MFPFKIAPAIVSLAWVAVIGAGITGVLWVAEELRKGAQAEVRAEYVAAEAKAAEDARKQADAAVDARLPAALPGSVARLRALWCRDCGVVQ